MYTYELDVYMHRSGPSVSEVDTPVHRLFKSPSDGFGPLFLTGTDVGKGFIRQDGYRVTEVSQC